MVDNKKILKAMKAAFSMTKQRCYNPRNRDYPHYGGRGIGVYQPWLEDFDLFVKDMGLRPPGMTLERRDNDKDYCPSNCVWATRLEQMSNTRKAKLIEYRGEVKSVAEWERHLGFKPGTLKARLGPLGYSVEQALTKGVVSGQMREGYKSNRRPVDSSKVARGESHYATKFRVDQVSMIRQLRAQGWTQDALAKKFSTTQATISAVCNKRGAYKE